MTDILKDFVGYVRTGRGHRRRVDFISINPSGWITLPDIILDKYGLRKCKTCTLYYTKDFQKIAIRFYESKEGSQAIRKRTKTASAGFSVCGLTRKVEGVCGVYFPFEQGETEDKSILVVYKRREN